MQIQKHKKYVFVMVFVFIFWLWITPSPAGIIINQGVGVTGDGCTSPVTFSYNFENSADVTASGNGCSNGDTIGTETSIAYESASPAPQEGTYSALFDGVTDSIVYDITDRDIFTEVQGNISIYFYLDAFTNNREIFKIDGDANNLLEAHLRTNTDNELRVRYRGNGTFVPVTTTNCDLSTGTWVHLIVRWQQTGDPNLLVDCNDGTQASSNTDLTAWTTAPVTFTLGDAGNLALEGNLDNLDIKNTYAD